MTTEANGSNTRLRKDLLERITDLISRYGRASISNVTGWYGKKYSNSTAIAELKAMSDEGIIYIMPSRKGDELLESDLIELHSETEAQDTSEDVEDWMRHISQLKDSDK